MKSSRVLGVLACLAAFAIPLSTVLAQAVDQAAPVAKKAKPNRAVTPAPKAKDAKWLEKYEAINARVKKGNYDLIFVGDSHVSGWLWSGPKYWKQYYEPRKAVNLGIGGDEAQHVLWRLDHGNIDGLSPKLAILEIGANNAHQKQTPEQICEGIKAIVDKLREKLPQTKILVIGLLPRGVKPDEPFRAIHTDTNKLVAKLADDKTVFFLDVGPKLLDSEGNIPKERLAKDMLHFSAEAYKIWAEEMEPTVAKLMGEK